MPSDSVSLALVTADRSCACISSISLLMHAEQLFRAVQISLIMEMYALRVNYYHCC